MLLYNTPHQAQQRTGQLLLHVTLTNQLRADLQPMSGAECSACFERGARGQAGRLTPYAYTRHMHGVCAAYARGLCAASVLHVHRIQHRICAAGWPSEHAIQWHRAEHGAARGGGGARARVDLVTPRRQGPRPRHLPLCAPREGDTPRAAPAHRLVGEEASHRCDRARRRRAHRAVGGRADEGRARAVATICARACNHVC